MIKILLISAFTLAVLAQNFQYDGDVLVLNDKNINAAIKKFDFILLEFYAEWCGHCKAFAPEYAQFATKMKEKQANYKVAKLNAGGQDKQASTKYKVESFPTVILLIKGLPLPYKGDRTADGLEVFMNSVMLDKVQKLHGEEPVLQFVSQNNISLMYFGKNPNDLKIIDLTSKAFLNVRFATIDDPYARKLYDLEDESIILIRTVDNRRIDFTGPITLQSLADFINQNSAPALEELDSRNNANLLNGNPALILFYDNGSVKLVDELRYLAPAIKQKLAVYTVGTSNKMLAQIISQLGLLIPAFPSLYYQKNSNTLFKLEGEINQYNIMRFVNRANQGMVNKKPVSKPVPEQNGPLKQLVGDTFIDTVIKARKDVFVQFCQISEGKCFIPEFEDLARELQHVQNLEIVYIDMKENQVDGFTSETYPAFKLYKDRLKLNPVDFKEEFSMENLRNFLKDQVEPWVELKSEL